MVQSAILVECLLMSISAKYICTTDLKNVLLLKCRENKMLGRVVSFLSDQHHICCIALSSCLIMGNTSAVVLTSWVRSNSFYLIMFLEYSMLQMISMKNKLAFASQQKTWGLAPSEQQSNTWLLMLPLAGAGSGSYRNCCALFPLLWSGRTEGVWVFCNWVSKSTRVKWLYGERLE